MIQNNIVLYVGIFCLSLIINYLLIKFQKTIPFIDIPNERSSHQVAIPRSGGIAIFIAFLLGIFIVNIRHDYGFITPLLCMFMIGIYDDWKNISSKKKLLLTMLCSGILYCQGFDIQRFGFFGGYEIIFSVSISFIFFCFVCAGFVNALNLIDGLDGLASFVSLVILFPFAYMGYKYDDPFLLNLPLILIMAIIGFVIFNWHPAKIFMGDSGSLTLGFIIVIIAVYAIKMQYITAVSVLLLAAVPILDTLTVMIRRILAGGNPFQADKTHIHHVFLRQQNNRTVRTVLLISAWQFLFSYIGLGFKVRDDIYILILFIVCSIIFYFSFTPQKRR